MDQKKKKKVYFPDRQERTTKSGFSYLIAPTDQPLHKGHDIPKPGKKAEEAISFLDFKTEGIA